MAEDLSEHYYVNLGKKDMFIMSETLDEVSAQPNPDYEQFLADVWVGIVLTLMVLSCICCMCSCLLYHKFQQWKRSVLETSNPATLEAGSAETELPSYTIASGLPTYQEALEQLKKVKEMTRKTENNECVPKETSPTPLSVITLFQLHNKTNEPVTNRKPS